MATFLLVQARTHDDPVRADERRSFADRLGVPLDSVVCHNAVYEAGDVAELCDGVDGVLVGGSGAFSVLDDHEWIGNFVDLLGGLSESGTPMFASCFGFQALVVAHGGEVASREAMSELGTHEIELTPGATDDPLLAGLPTRFPVQQGHKDSAVRLPSNAVLLARSARCPHQAIRLGEGPVYAFQFHPELTEDENRKRFVDYGSHYDKAVEKARMLEVLQSFKPTPEAAEMLARFRRLTTGAGD